MEGFNVPEKRLFLCPTSFIFIPFIYILPVYFPLKVPRLGMMLVGWGGNNGSTVTGAILANKLGLSWHTKEGKYNLSYSLIKRVIWIFYCPDCLEPHIHGYI